MRPPQAPNLIRTVEHGTDWSQRVYRPVRVYTNRHLEELLSKPGWSVRSLLPPPTSSLSRAPSPSTEPVNNSQEPSKEDNTQPRASATALGEEITPSKLQHLLRLSALPLPRNNLEEASMIATLRSQIHFVRAIQAVDTTDVKPLVAIRDETAEGIAEQTVRLADLKPWLELEEKVGGNGTLRRRKIESERTAEGGKLKMGEMHWDAFGLGVGGGEGEGRRRGRWFVVKKKTKKNAAVQEGESGSDGKVNAAAGEG